MNFEYEKSAADLESESLTRMSAKRRTTKKSEALKGIKLAPPETLDEDYNKWKNSQRFN